MGAKVSRKRVQDILAGGFCVAVAFFVYQWKGPSQLGNAFSFNGTVLTLLPPLTQYLMNRRYRKAQSEPSSAETDPLDRLAERARRRRLMTFDMRDFGYITAGLIMAALGFLLQILTAKADA